MSSGPFAIPTMTTVCAVKPSLTPKPQNSSSFRTILLCLSYRAMKAQILMTIKSGVSRAGRNHTTSLTGSQRRRWSASGAAQINAPRDLRVWQGVYQFWWWTPRTNMRLLMNRWKWNKVRLCGQKLWPANWLRVHLLHRGVVQQGLLHRTGNGVFLCALSWSVILLMDVFLWWKICISGHPTFMMPPKQCIRKMK